MDYSLAAVKVVCDQLKHARQTLSQNAVTLGGILFQRAWLQGILISSPDDDGKLLLDDGTGVIQLSLAGEFLLRQWNPGMYVMVVGGYIFRTDDSPMIKVHKIVDLSAFPDREAMWYLEVIEAYKLFYQPLIEEFV
ncbi:hypothetical protein LWI29_011144 [Acer saccharum]|uniref:RecQ-mediated genome instability protein 2 n=1 Tax=Acer saccharum TaxID=4024 RepID=A0AA39T610_ACESA|nr:hypothetical protein LWI29_011144 [Acer saccharum]KAK1588321.1 hypothetical protein Q3G72_022081 [Acer saccharum]